MKFKFTHKISVKQQKFLVFLTCSEGLLEHIRGPDLAHGLCTLGVEYMVEICYASSLLWYTMWDLNPVADKCYASFLLWYTIWELNPVAD